MLVRSTSVCNVRLRLLATAIIGAGLLLIANPSFAQNPWPGQSGNAVGYAAVGPLGTSACPAPTSGTSGSPRVISNCAYSPCPTVSESYVVFMSVDFDCGTSGLSITGSNITLYGSRVQSNDQEDYAVQVSGSNVYFMYTSVTPLATYYKSPPGAAWPSASAVQNTTSCNSDAYCINGNEGYEYGINILQSSGAVWIDHGDIWGFGNSVVFSGTTAPITLTDSWIHDAADASLQGYHTDGPGYLNGSSGPSNILIEGNTIASLGNTNGIAFQAATAGYSGLRVNQNYMSGFGYTVAFCAPGSTECKYSTFEGNTYGTDVEPVWGPLYNSVAIASSTVWACNRINVASGTAWTDGNGWKPSSSQNGEFLVPGQGYNSGSSATDYNGNTVCAKTNPAAVDFQTQSPNTSSTGQTVTLTNTGSSTLTISSIALASGTQFVISSNTCGSSLVVGSSCNITVQFTPTSQGPQTDMLQIVDNATGLGSPQIVPLIGLATTPGVRPDAPTGLTVQ